MAFGVLAGSRVVRIWMQPEWSGDDVTGIVLGGGLALVLLAYGLHAVFRARRISRS